MRESNLFAHLDACTGRRLFPCWSPDGRQIAFLRQLDARDWETSRVCVIPARGGEPRQITTDADQVAISSVAWSPDGRLITFYSRDGAVKVIPPEGGPARVIARDASTEWGQNFSWSPGGARVAYRDKSGKLVTVAIDGKEDPKPVEIDLERANFSQFVWSPDGSRFVFKAVSYPNNELWLMEGARLNVADSK